MNGNGLCIPAYQTEELEVGVEKSEPVELGQGLVSCFDLPLFGFFFFAGRLSSCRKFFHFCF